MAYELWSQDNFTKGELSPFMYSRNSVDVYYNGMKQAQNVLTYPTGAAGKRFGTLYQATLSGFTASTFYFETFQYLNECVYQLIFKPEAVDIFLEGILAATVTSTGLDGDNCHNLSSTVIGSAFRVAGQGFKPKDLTRSAGTPNAILSVAANAFTITTPVTAGQVLPVRFTAVALPTTSPQIKAGITYFVKNLTTTTVAVYASAYNAKFDIDRFTLTTAGTTANVIYQNTWALTAVSFKSTPVFDFNGLTSSYDGITFTPTGVAGNGVVINLNVPYAPLTTAYIGGAFIGGGGVTRIINVNSTSQFVVATEVPFDAAVGIQGSLAFLAEPAWSDVRGWPQKCSSYQNRAIFANNDSLPNGFWASVINDYYDFNDLQSDDDSAISWYPSSDNVNFIRFIVPYRSITVHTNTGIYSSPLSDVAAITPTNFSLQLQDSTPATVLQPRAIDNQIIVVSGNDVHTMLWDGINNAYTSDIISVVSEQLVRDPVDETPFADLSRAGSRYIFIVNSNGSMAVYQTLISQSIGGFTPHIMEQYYGDAAFRQVGSSADGRCWFVCEREIATAGSALDIVAVASTIMQASGAAFSTTEPTAITFTTTGSLPTSDPQITTTAYFWAVGYIGDTFFVFTNKEDADASIAAGLNVNPISFSALGSNSKVVPWPATSAFTLEELNQDVKLDCAVYYTGTPASTIATGALFNAQNVKMLGDGFGFEAQGFGNNVVFSAHGVTTPVSTAYIGFPINLVIEPMPLSMTTGYSQKNTSLTKPKHIRTARFMFNNTIGGTINGVPIALTPLDQTPIGEPPLPARGIFEMGLMPGWDDFNYPSFVIEHDEPFDIQLLGIYYSVEV